jgi:hypothetical protein
MFLKSNLFAVKYLIYLKIILTKKSEFKLINSIIFMEIYENYIFRLILINLIIFNLSIFI